MRETSVSPPRLADDIGRVSGDPNVAYVKPKKVLLRPGPDDLLLDEDKSSSGGSSTGKFDPKDR